MWRQETSAGLKLTPSLQLPWAEQCSAALQVGYLEQEACSSSKAEPLQDSLHSLCSTETDFKPAAALG